jgi:hypothetical protein
MYEQLHWLHIEID